ncbi:MAG: DNA mismatch repair protein MutS, partial [Clostridia bacterium]|nr:DNA mismatch repair protein MutS [Clostridia bacterium]
VAKLAGLPNEVIRRAKEVLAQVEETARALQTPTTHKEEPRDEGLISFEDCINEQVIDALRAVDLNTLSPYEAMSFLFDLKKRLQ